MRRLIHFSMAIFLCWFITFASAAHGALAANAAPLTLRAAVDYAVEHSPTLDVARRQDLADELAAKSAFAAFFPSLDFTSSHGVQGTINAPGSTTLTTALVGTGIGPWVSTVGLNVSENLYDNGATITGYRMASEQREISHLNFVKARENLTLSIANEFYNYSLSTKLLDVRAQRKQILDHQYHLIENAFRQGVKTKQDYLRFKTQVQKADIDFLSAETALANSASELKRLMGGIEAAQFAPVGPETALPEFPTAPPPASKIFDVQLAESGKRLNALAENLVVRRYWPQVALAASTGYSFNNYLGSSASNPSYGAFGYSALLSVTYNLWDFGVRRNNVQIAEQQRFIADDNLAAAVVNDSDAIERLMDQLQLLKRQYSLTKELLGLSQTTYSLLEEQYRLGKITYLDLITGLNDLLDAKTGFLSTHYSSLQNLAQYRYYEGSLYGEIEK